MGNNTFQPQQIPADFSGEGYTWALGHLAGSLKNLITGSQPWGGRWKNRKKHGFWDDDKKFPKVPRRFVVL